jgi:PAS domain S-box-containing protein
VEGARSAPSEIVMTANSSKLRHGEVGCPLEDVVITPLLGRRPTRAPRHAEENAALVALSKELVDAPDRVLQSLADTACHLCGAESAGISLQEVENGRELFRWRATSGRMTPYLNGVMPRDFSPCGVVIDRRATQLMADPARHYLYISQLGVPFREVLLTPFFKRDVAIGTVWIAMHGPGREFDQEDARLVENIARFASLASEMLSNSVEVEGLGRQLAVVGSQIDHALEAANIGTWNWDPANDRIYVDAKTARLFGVSEEEANGGAAEIFLNKLHPEDRPPTAAAMERALLYGSLYKVEFRVMQADGSCRWVRSHGQPHPGATNGAVRMPGVVVDITEQRRAEEALRRSEAMLAEQNRRLEESVAERTAELDAKIRELEAFAYTISHDLRAPLRAMRSYAQLLVDEMGSQASSEARDYARRIERGAERMDQLTQDVLVVSQLAGPSLPLTSIDLDAFLAQMLETAPDLSSDHADIIVRSPLVPVLANHAALTQCISNLLSNAVKFVEPGVRPRIHVWTERARDRVRVFVKDNGIGIDASHHPRVFDLFYRIAPDARSSGIGLVLVRRSAERMGGAVGFESVAGNGSTFCLELNAAGGA